MQRRTFLKTTAAISSAVLLTPNLAFSNETSNPFGITSKPRKSSLKNSTRLIQVKSLHNFGFHFQKTKVIIKL